MTTSIIWKGKRRYTPGFYGEVEADSLDTLDTSFGRVAVVGAFGEFEQNTPYGFVSKRQVAAYSGDNDLNTIADALFTPTTDNRVDGGASAVVFVNAATTTQAQAYLVDGDALDALRVLARRSGASSNGTTFRLETSGLDASKLKAIITRNGATESLDLLGGVKAFDVWCEAADVAASAFTSTQSQILWTWETGLKSFSAPGSGLTQKLTWENTGGLLVDGPVTLTLDWDGNPGNASSISVVISGTNDAGAPVSVTTSIPGAHPDGGTVVTSEVFTSVTSVAFTTSDTAFAGGVRIGAPAFDLDPSDSSVFSTVGSIVERLKSGDTSGFKVSVLYPSLASVPAVPSGVEPGGMDKGGDTNVYTEAEKHTVTVSMWDIVSQINARSEIVEVEQILSVNEPLTSPQSLTLVGGGTTKALTSAQWDAALNSIVNEDIQIVVAHTEDVTVHPKLVEHASKCVDAGYDRNIYTGAPKSLTLASLLSTYVLPLDSASVSVAAQEIEIVDSLGRTVWKDPVWLAYYAAGMQAGTEVGTSQTKKRTTKVLRTRQAWDLDEDTDQVIQSGIFALKTGRFGLEVLKATTTYVTRSNPVYSEVGPWESCQTSLRDLRSVLEIRLGDRALETAAQSALLVAESTLNDQKKANIIRDFRNLALVEKSGWYAFTYDLVPIFTVNFITVRGSAKTA